VALGHGMSDKEIAEHLCIRHQTVRTHMVNLLGELGIESRL
jgi:DNA-binding NarL/FixJ family response regulator